MHVFSGFAFLRLRDFCENGPFFEIISLQIILACAAARNVHLGWTISHGINIGNSILMLFTKASCYPTYKNVKSQ